MIGEVRGNERPRVDRIHLKVRESEKEPLWPLLFGVMKPVDKEKGHQDGQKTDV